MRTNIRHPDPPTLDPSHPHASSPNLRAKNFFQGPDPPDVPPLLLKGPCGSLLVSPHEAESLCRRHFHSPQIPGPFLSNVVSQRESILDLPQDLKTTFHMNQAQIFVLHQLALGSPYEAAGISLGEE